MKIDVLMELSSDGLWWASSADEPLAGFVSGTGSTREEAVADFQVALSEYIEYQAEKGIDVPKVTELDVHELVAI